MEDTEIVSRAQKGDFKAFEELVELYQKRVFSFAIYHVKNKADAEDVSQEVFWRIFNYIKKYDSSRKFFSWVYAIELNVIKSFFRKKKKHFLVLNEDILNLIVFHDDGLLSSDDKITLFKALDKIDIEERNILFYKYIDDLSIKEIAEIYRISEENVKVRIFRAKEKIQKILGGKKNDG